MDFLAECRKWDAHELRLDQLLRQNIPLGTLWQAILHLSDGKQLNMSMWLACARVLPTIEKCVQLVVSMLAVCFDASVGRCQVVRLQQVSLQFVILCRENKVFLAREYVFGLALTRSRDAFGGRSFLVSQVGMFNIHFQDGAHRSTTAVWR